MELGPDSTQELRWGLEGYLRAVAAEIGVPVDGTSFEISDTATAYLAIAPRWSAHPGRDLMLTWGERTGWMLEVETDPTEATAVMARLGGDDPVPEPDVVARFVRDVVAGRVDEDRPEKTDGSPTTGGRRYLADRLSRYGADR